ncbi:unnamed protein product [Arctogadus glacialis]
MSLNKSQWLKVLKRILLTRSSTIAVLKLDGYFAPSTDKIKFNKVDLSFRRLKGRPDVWQLGVMVQRPNAALNYTSVSYSP